MPGTTLTVAGDYSGNGGVLHVTTVLGGDASPTDLLEVQGDTSGRTTVEVVNAGGEGAQTVEGIKIIDVEGRSAGQFTLAGDRVLDGQPVIAAGPFLYALQKNGIADPTDGDWYLRSFLAGRSRSTKRIRRRCWRSAVCRRCRSGSATATGAVRATRPPCKGAGTTAGAELPSGGLVEDQRAWARVEGARNLPAAGRRDRPGAGMGHGHLAAAGRHRPAGARHRRRCPDRRRHLQLRHGQHRCLVVLRGRRDRHRGLWPRRQPDLAAGGRRVRRRAGAGDLVRQRPLVAAARR